MKVVVLIEGTGNSGEGNPSAISRLASMLVDDKSRGQVVIRVSGSGTHGCSWFKWICSITGWDSGWIVSRLLRRIHDVTNKLPHTEDVHFYIFGFSRGAYQALCLAAKLCGEMKSWPLIKYIGLLDAVKSVLGTRNSLGFKLPDSANGRHAVAIHEYRRKFKPIMLVEDCAKGHLEEKFFIGAHSDVGWAYNGKRNEKSRLHFLHCGNFRCRYNRAHTKLAGKIALSWILSPVKNDLLFKDSLSQDECTAMMMEDTPQTLLDYINLSQLFSFIIHNSIYEASNLWGYLSAKSRCIKGTEAQIRARLHFSARAVFDMLNSHIVQSVIVRIPMLYGKICLLGKKKLVKTEEVDLINLLRGSLIFEKFDPRLFRLHIKDYRKLRDAFRCKSSEVLCLLRSKGYNVSNCGSYIILLVGSGILLGLAT